MNCSFCATQLPADAVYCAECGRPAMSRRARRGAAVAESARQPVKANERSASKKSEALFGSRRRRKRDSAAVIVGDAAKAGVESQAASADVATKRVIAEPAPLAGVGASGDAQAPAISVAETRREAPEAPHASLGDHHDRDESAEEPRAELPSALHDALPSAPDVLQDGARTLRLGDPLVLAASADIEVARHDAAASDVNLSSVSAAESSPASSPDPDILGEVADMAETMPFDEDGPYGEVLPFDEDGPYDEVANPAALSFDHTLVVGSVAGLADPAVPAHWRDMPAPVVEHKAESAIPAAHTAVSDGKGADGESGDENAVSAELVAASETSDNSDDVVAGELAAEFVPVAEQNAETELLTRSGSDNELHGDGEIAGEAELVVVAEPTVEAEPTDDAEPMVEPQSAMPVDTSTGRAPIVHAESRVDNVDSAGEQPGADSLLTPTTDADADPAPSIEEDAADGAAAEEPGVKAVAVPASNLPAESPVSPTTDDADETVVESAASEESDLPSSTVGEKVDEAEALTPENETKDPDEPMASDNALSDREALSEEQRKAEGSQTIDAPGVEQVMTEPEPLVEPAPLPRSSFEPDLSMVGRPDTITPAAELFRAKPVRPLGEEAIFTTADRLRASAFAPVASERVASRPAPAPAVSAEEETPAESAAEPEGHGTQPRVEAAAKATTDALVSAQVASAAVQPAPADAAVADEAAATCTQCGNELAESDIFCGSCGFVKHGVGPSSRTAPAVLDPFPWGTPAANEAAVSDPELEESSSAEVGVDPRAADPEIDNSVVEIHDNNGVDESREEVSEAEPDAVVNLAEKAEPIVGLPRDGVEAIPLIEPGAEVPDVLPVAISAARTPEASAAVSKPADAPSANEPPAGEQSVDESNVKEDSAAGNSRSDRGARFDEAQAALSPPPRLEVAPPLEPATETSVESPNDAVSQNSAGAPAFSVLAPPPKSNQRVELPISPPVPLAAFDADDEDIEDTRIVERSVTGTRFVLQFSTGDSVIVTGNGLVGRNPIPEPSEKFDIVVPITDPSKSVSKTHLEFGQMSSVFWISDRYSGNGTIVREPGAEPKRCEPGKRYRVVRGTRVEIGEQFFIVS